MNTPFSLETLATASPNTLASARTMAMGAGDLTIFVREEVRKVMREENGERVEAVRRGLDQLRERDLINAGEARALGDICGLVFSARRGEDASRAALAVRERYEQMLADRHCGPTALAIASVASSAYTLRTDGRASGVTVGTEDRPGVAFASVSWAPSSTTAGAVGGAVIGAAVGGAIGGLAGAGIGAIIGGAVGGAVGWCNETGN